MFSTREGRDTAILGVECVGSGTGVKDEWQSRVSKADLGQEEYF